MVTQLSKYHHTYKIRGEKTSYQNLNILSMYTHIGLGPYKYIISKKNELQNLHMYFDHLFMSVKKHFTNSQNI